METLLSLYGVVGLVYGIYKVTQWGHGISPDLGENSSRVLSWFMLLVWVLPLAIILWPLIPLWERWEREEPVRILKGKIIDEWVQKRTDEQIGEYRQKKQKEQQGIDAEVERRFREFRDMLTSFGTRESRGNLMRAIREDSTGWTTRNKERIRNEIEEEKLHLPGWQKPDEHIENLDHLLMPASPQEQKRIDAEKRVDTLIDASEKKGTGNKKTALLLLNNNRAAVNEYIEETILSITGLGTVNGSMLNDKFFKSKEAIGTLHGSILARECFKIIIKKEKIELGNNIDDPRNYPPEYRELLDIVRSYVAMFLNILEMKNRIK
ncbi:MAG TPA: hypothetical protein DEF00_05130 [Candidatus Taylorbacteria bacterium]|uniref:Uncharacterized protein n=1 Tax=Candidatus Magasanikbacteria bacterium GW2011_GWA2_42_32 TaxID=1619039 RepID=A0A0G1A5T4_9BACT|nr:MAG: hypothetical protein UV20_C0014G0010 [Candidatus Magasanikbacteria bacterium GW2011_GWA2_42_32]KKU97223.1 MAG: hypothetical protein UY29_C0001G0017 [Parcubacteria group bacterium GW2011_GWC2_48_17]HBV01730.1 hypothetical protein [Candidatus Taylorbacteria bacterium]